MATYLLQLAYTPESIAAQIKTPQDRMATAAKPLVEAVGGTLLGGGFCFGAYDAAFMIEAADDETAAAVSLAVSAGGAIKTITTTRLLSGKQYVSALKKAAKLSPSYSPMK
jgi:uncharacterized protein with GYD domain